MTKLVQGIVRGKTIELAEDAEELGLVDGQQVEVKVSVVPTLHTWGEGLRRCAGAFADEWTADDDRILQEIYMDRRSS